jgi:regulator of sigma E protease
MTVAHYVIAALGLAVLMIVHESGHYLAARRFGMRVTRFSIGFGPRIVKHQPKGSPTVFQVALVPFLAYVQIAGMNPYEESDPKDPGSYQNASLWARVATIGAGPLANYLFASMLFFFGFILGGRTVLDEKSMRVSIPSGEPGPAYVAGIRDGDKVLRVNGEPVADWPSLRKAVSAHPGEEIDVEIERAGEPAPLHIKVTPGAKGTKNEGKIVVIPEKRHEAIPLGEAAILSVTEPPKVVAALIVGLSRWITGKEKLEGSGPVGIVKETAAAVKMGAGETLQLLGAISAYLGGFNLLPFPALDGGRLLFLGFEAAARRKPDAKIEARVHALGLLMLLTLIAIFTYTDIVPKH